MPDSSPHSVLDEVVAELEYLMSAANRPGTVSHHDAEDAESRLLAHVRGLEEQLEVAQHERNVATSWAAELAGEKRALQASVEIIQQERDELRAFLTEVTWHEDIEGNSALRAEDFEKLRQLLYVSNPASERP